MGPSLEQYQEVVKEHGIGGALALQLDEDDLIQMGVAMAVGDITTLEIDIAMAAKDISMVV